MALANNKKGSFVFNLLLVLALILILTYTSFKFLTTDKTKQTQEIGEMQINLINMYTSAEKANLYLEQSAKYTQGETLSSFYTAGGYYKSPCGKIANYNLWVKGAQNCFLTKGQLLKELNYFFNESLNNYSNNYQDINLMNNYDIGIDNNYFVINGSEIPLKQNGLTYYFKPYIRIKSDEDTSLLLSNIEKIKININNCKNNIDCWQKIDNSFKITQNGKALIFEIDTQKSVGYFNKSNLVLKFGLDFSDNNPLFTP
jgi:hypothetical protein